MPIPLRRIVIIAIIVIIASLLGLAAGENDTGASIAGPPAALSSARP